MSDEPKARQIPNVSFGTVEGDAVIGDQHKGDVVQGHKGNVVDTGGGNVEGDVNQTYAENMTVEEYLDKAIEACKECKFTDETPQDVIDDYETPVGLMTAVKTEALEDISAIQEYEPSEFSEKKKTWTERLKSMAPFAMKIGLNVGAAVLDSYVKKSPVVAGLQALVGTIQSES